MKNFLKNRPTTNRRENNHAIYIKKDNILYVLFKDNLVLNHTAAQEIVRDRLKFQAYTSYPVICDVSGIQSIDEEARRYLATMGSNQLNAAALVSHNATLYEMGTYYKELDTPKAPTEVFSTMEAAEEYIKKLKTR